MSFPNGAYIRLLRKNLKRKVDGEEWWEGVYEDKIGYFPSIFVDSLNELKIEPVSIDMPDSPENQKVP